MNDKPQNPKSLKNDTKDSNMNQLMISLIATTISIILTFGTAAIIDHFKKKAEKRDMVVMILKDLNKTIEHIQDIDSVAVHTFETQISILENPETFEARKLELLVLQVASTEKPLKTVENIFSSNIETINTLGNQIYCFLLILLNA